MQVLNLVSILTCSFLKTGVTLQSMRSLQAGLPMLEAKAEVGYAEAAVKVEQAYPQPADMHVLASFGNKSAGAD